MSKYLVLYVSVLLLEILAAQLLSKYHQEDYNIKMERAEAVWFNNSVYRYFKLAFVPINRTQRAVNYTSFQFVDFTRDVRVKVQCYKFMSNEYRFFPITVDVNVCEEYDRNTLNIKALLKNKSNAYSCPWKKGQFYVRNFVPDFSSFPPYIPHGAYKMQVKMYHKSDFVVELHFYGSVMAKPSKWEI